MSKLSFRARALDCSKPMPVYRSEEIPDLPDFAAINRAVPQMPTGMEKEEETEHHLQRALSAQQVYGTAEALVIPVPEIDTLGDDYDRLYPTDYRVSKQYIHIQALGMDQEIPDYDMDSDDEVWLNEQTKKMELTPVQFEEMMDRLEKGSGQQVVTLQEAKLLLKQDDDLTMSVYDYWLNKKLRMQHALIPQVKSEKRDGTTTNNPYVAFRRRTEKMQTRKNRKNDEASYEKMLKLRRDLNKAVTILEMIKKREKCKKELLQLTIEILEKRYQMDDFCGQHLTYAESQKTTRPAIYPVFEQFKVAVPKVPNDTEVATTNRKPKREYKKRKHKQAATTLPGEAASAAISYMPNSYEVDVIADAYSSDEERQSPDLSGSDRDDENDPDGSFAFRRKKFCSYQAPLGYLGDWPWSSSAEGGSERRRHGGDDDEMLRYRYCLTSVARPQPRFIGFARRRVGRGGRVLLDRALAAAHEPWDAELERYLERPPSAAWPSGPAAARELHSSSGSDNQPPRPLHFWPTTGVDQPPCDAAAALTSSGPDACAAFSGVACSLEAAECRDSLSDRELTSAAGSSSLLVHPLQQDVLPPLSQQQQQLLLLLQQQSRGRRGSSAETCSAACLRGGQQELSSVQAAVKLPPPDFEQQASGQTANNDADSHHFGLQSLSASAAASGSRLAHSFSSQPSSRFVVDSAQARHLAAASALATSGTNGAHRATGMGQANGPVAKGTRQPSSSAGATPYVVATADTSATHSSAVNCGGSTPMSILSTKPGSAASFPAVLRVGVTPNESGDSLSMSSLVQSELDYGETLLRPGINNMDAVTSMEVS